jgi:electron transfer flavoprotein alpha subunit
VLSVDHPALERFVPEAYVAALAALVGEREPRLVLIANTTVGMDVAGALSARTGRPLVAYCTALEREGDAIVATSQLYGGKMNAEVVVDGPAIASVIAGSFAAVTGGSASVEDVPAPELGTLHTEFLARVEPEAADVDITAEEVLVSVGRGIGGAENIELAQELADALGATVSASRPVTDAGWLPKTRQVGKSGRTVKPKLYIACGISGAPEHLEGMSDAELIIAINSDEKAPIFDVAHYGTTEDLFDVLPALTDQLQAVRA